MARGELSEAAIQKQVRQYLATQAIDSIHFAGGVWGLPYAVVRSVDDVKETLEQWGWR